MQGHTLPLLHTTQDYLKQRDISIVCQSPYSPDLNLCDRFLFRAIKQDLKNDDFDGPEGVNRAIQQSIWLLSKNTLMDQLGKLGDFNSQIHWSLICFPSHCVVFVYWQSLPNNLIYYIYTVIKDVFLQIFLHFSFVCPNGIPRKLSEIWCFCIYSWKII